MKWNKFKLSIICIVFLSACSGVGGKNKISIPEIAFPIDVSSDLTIVNITEYLGEGIKIKKVKLEDSISCNIMQDSLTLSLTTKSFNSPLSNLSVNTNKGNFDILIRNTKYKKWNDLRPHLIGERIEKNKISFSIENDVDSIFVYVNNVLLPRKNLIIKDALYSIDIPKQAQSLDYSTLRVYAFSYAYGVSNEFSVPIFNGENVQDLSNVDTTFVATDSLKAFFADDNYMALYKEALNTFVYYSKNFIHLDSLMRKNIMDYGLYRLVNETLKNKNYKLDYFLLSHLNDDVARILTDYKEPKSLKRVYDNINQLNAFLMTIPGPPSYYIKPIKANEHNSALEFDFFKLEELRKTNIPLIYGSYETLRKDDMLFAYVRKYFDQFTIVVFNRSRFMQKRKIKLHTSFIDAKATALFKSKFDITMGDLLIELQPNSVEIISGEIIK